MRNIDNNHRDFDKYIEYVLLEISKSNHENANIFIEDIEKLKTGVDNTEKSIPIIREISKLSESLSKILGVKIAIYSDWWKYLN